MSQVLTALPAYAPAPRDRALAAAHVAMTMAMVFLFATMTTYLAGSEVILEDVYDYGSWFPLFFGAIAVLLAVLRPVLLQTFGVFLVVTGLVLLGLGLWAGRRLTHSGQGESTIQPMAPFDLGTALGFGAFLAVMAQTVCPCSTACSKTEKPQPLTISFTVDIFMP